MFRYLYTFCVERENIRIENLKAINFHNFQFSNLFYYYFLFPESLMLLLVGVVVGVWVLLVLKKKKNYFSHSK